MAQRPVFVMKTSWPWYTETEVSFKYFAGFALVQRQRNIAGIHEAFLKMDPSAHVLEASSKAPTELGKSLSPFYLMTNYEGGTYPVECVFQAVKVFQKGGPFLQLLHFEPVKAKTTSITKTAGPLLYYDYNGEHWPLDPKGWLYNWLYMKALQKQPELVEAIGPYNAFTDIAFNPKTGSTCQAKALAIYKGLQAKGKLDEAMKSIPDFFSIVYKDKSLIQAQKLEESISQDSEDAKKEPAGMDASGSDFQTVPDKQEIDAVSPDHNDVDPAVL